MRHLKTYILFNEARLGDISKIIGNNELFNEEQNNDSEFIKYKTISKRIDNKKLRLNIIWNDRIDHNIEQKIINRTPLKNKNELNILLDKGLDELYINFYDFIKDNGTYSLWFSEYNFCLITNIEKNNITIVTILSGQIDNNVKNIIELKSTI